MEAAAAKTEVKDLIFRCLQQARNGAGNMDQHTEDSAMRNATSTQKAARKGPKRLL